jgi:hypothetical protein
MKNHNDGCWNRSRAALKQLFQGYVDDYGDKVAGQIIRTIIDVLGGCRFTIAESIPNNADNLNVLITLYSCLCDRFQRSSAEAIMRKFLIELKGLRISFPDHDDLYREERNNRIRAMYPASSYKELSIRFDLDIKQVWRIVNEE